MNLKTRVEEISDIFEYAKNIPTDLIDPATGVPVLEWLNSFTEEYVNTNFKHKGIKIMDVVEARRERWRRNNYRNLDIFSREKAQGKLDYIEDIKDGVPGDEVDLDANIENDDDFYFWDKKKT